jgi:hypothetical protein
VDLTPPIYYFRILAVESGLDMSVNDKVQRSILPISGTLPHIKPGEEFTGYK